MAIMTLGETSMQKTYFFSLIFSSSPALKVLPLLRLVFVLSGRQCIPCCLLQQRAIQFLIQCRGLFLNPSFQMHWVVVFLLLWFSKPFLWPLYLVLNVSSLNPTYIPCIVLSLPLSLGICWHCPSSRHVFFTWQLQSFAVFSVLFHFFFIIVLLIFYYSLISLDRCLQTAKPDCF